MAIRTRSPSRRIPLSSLLPYLSHVAPQQTSPPKRLHAVSSRPQICPLIHPTSHPSAAVFPVVNLPLAASSDPWRAPAIISTLIHPTNGCVPAANPRPHIHILCQQPSAPFPFSPGERLSYRLCLELHISCRSDTCTPIYNLLILAPICTQYHEF